jgi:hypothetical protein
MTHPDASEREFPYEPNQMDRRSQVVEEMAAFLAWDRGGQTHPLCSYDLDRAEEMVTGEVNLRAENERLKKRVAELEGVVQ